MKRPSRLFVKCFIPAFTLICSTIPVLAKSENQVRIQDYSQYSDCEPSPPKEGFDVIITCSKADKKSFEQFGTPVDGNQLIRLITTLLTKRSREEAGVRVDYFTIEEHAYHCEKREKMVRAVSTAGYVKGKLAGEVRPLKWITNAVTKDTVRFMSRYCPISPGYRRAGQNEFRVDGVIRSGSIVNSSMREIGQKDDMSFSINCSKLTLRLQGAQQDILISPNSNGHTIYKALCK